jgi:hypothetical protein
LLPQTAEAEEKSVRSRNGEKNTLQSASAQNNTRKHTHEESERKRAGGDREKLPGVMTGGNR